jgi:hypothetical protein
LQNLDPEELQHHSPVFLFLSIQAGTMPPLSLIAPQVVNVKGPVRLALGVQVPLQFNETLAGGMNPNKDGEIDAGVWPSFCSTELEKDARHNREPEFSLLLIHDYD